MKRLLLKLLLRIFLLANFFLFHTYGYRWANLIFSLSVGFYCFGCTINMLVFEFGYIVLIELAANFIYTEEMRADFYSDGLDIAEGIREKLEE